MKKILTAAALAAAIGGCGSGERVAEPKKINPVVTFDQEEGFRTAKYYIEHSDPDVPEGHTRHLTRVIVDLCARVSPSYYMRLDSDKGDANLQAQEAVSSVGAVSRPEIIDSGIAIRACINDSVEPIEPLPLLPEVTQAP